MDIRSILGTLGTVIGLVRAVPQLVRLLRAQEAYGVSVDTAATSSIVSLGWTVYGVLTNQPYVVFATGSSGVIFAICTFLALRYGVRSGNSKLPQFGLAFCSWQVSSQGKTGLGWFCQ